MYTVQISSCWKNCLHWCGTTLVGTGDIPKETKFNLIHFHDCDNISFYEIINDNFDEKKKIIECVTTLQALLKSECFSHGLDVKNK